MAESDAWHTRGLRRWTNWVAACFMWHILFTRVAHRGRKDRHPGKKTRLYPRADIKHLAEVDDKAFPVRLQLSKPSPYSGNNYKSAFPCPSMMLAAGEHVPLKHCRVNVGGKSGCLVFQLVTKSNRFRLVYIKLHGSVERNGNGWIGLSKAFCAAVSVGQCIYSKRSLVIPKKEQGITSR